MDMPVNDTMRILQDLDDSASIGFDGQQWYVRDRVEVGGDGVLSSPFVRGDTPEAAVQLHFDMLTKVQAPYYLVTDAMAEPPDGRRHRVWNGLTWRDVPRVKAAPR